MSTTLFRARSGPTPQPGNATLCRGDVSAASTPTVYRPRPRCTAPRCVVRSAPHLPSTDVTVAVATHRQATYGRLPALLKARPRRCRHAQVISGEQRVFTCSCISTPPRRLRPVCMPDTAAGRRSLHRVSPARRATKLPPLPRRHSHSQVGSVGRSGRRRVAMDAACIAPADTRCHITPYSVRIVDIVRRSSRSRHWRRRSLRLSMTSHPSSWTSSMICAGSNAPLPRLLHSTALGVGCATPCRLSSRPHFAARLRNSYAPLWRATSPSVYVHSVTTGSSYGCACAAHSSHPTTSVKEPLHVLARAATKPSVLDCQLRQLVRAAVRSPTHHLRLAHIHQRVLTRCAALVCSLLVPRLSGSS